jgi:hypothetical protein
MISSPKLQVEPGPGGDLTIEELERRHITLVLQRVNERVDQGAAKLGIPRSTLYSKIKQYQLTTNSTRAFFQIVYICSSGELRDELRMTKPYDDDLRRKFLAALDRGEDTIPELSGRLE